MSADLYFIECEATIKGRRVTYFAERDCDRMNRSNTVDDIRTGQLENVRSVICVNVEENIAQDVSEDIAQEVANDLDVIPSGQLRDFLEEHLGIRAMVSIEREIEMAGA